VTARNVGFSLPRFSEVPVDIKQVYGQTITYFVSMRCELQPIASTWKSTEQMQVFGIQIPKVGRNRHGRKLTFGELYVIGFLVDGTVMHILLAAIGTAGDVLPLAGLGRALAERGHVVKLASTPNFRRVAEAGGLQFHSLEGIPGAAGHRDLYHPTRGMQLVADRLLIPALKPVYDLIATLDISRWRVIDNGYAFGARIAQEKHGHHLTTCIVSPICLRSLEAMPVNPGINLPPGAPMILRRAFFSVISRMWDRRIAPALNSFRREKGLPAVRGVWYDWRLSPERVVGLFPEWFAPRPPDWPSQFVHGGFTVFDGDGEGETPEALFRAKLPVVVFTAGSAGEAAADFFQAALDASRDRSWLAVLLTGGFRPPGLAERANTPPNPLIFDYVPLTRLLPASALVVHHGGLGTMSLAAASGTPQIVVPFGHDQFDNAARVERLGIGRSIRKGAGLAQRLGNLIEEMLSDGTCCRRSKALAPRARSEEALDRICSQIESDEGRSFPVGCSTGYRQAV